jgi:hypothetical protein
MADITLRSNEDLTTLERGYSSNPLDMPESETFAAKEYVIASDRFMEAYANWDRDERAMLGLNDELSRLEIWLSAPAAERVKRAIEAGKDSVDLF